MMYDGGTNLESLHCLFELLHLLEPVMNLLLDLSLRGAKPLLRERTSNTFP